MAQNKKIKLSPFELKAMEALWKLGRASIREILEQLPGKRRPAYTTVQTVVYRLEAKGAVRKLRKIGNAHIFVPVISREGRPPAVGERFPGPVQRIGRAGNIPTG